MPIDHNSIFPSSLYALAFSRVSVLPHVSLISSNSASAPPCFANAFEPNSQLHMSLLVYQFEDHTGWLIVPAASVDLASMLSYFGSREVAVED